MSGCLSLRYLPDDMVRTALGYPTAKPHGSNKTRVGAESLKQSEPLYYNSLLDGNVRKHRGKLGVRKHLHNQGCTSRHGSAYPTALELIEATRVERLDKQRMAALKQQIVKRERQLVRLNKQAKCDSVIFTKFGAFERRDDILPSLNGGASSKGKKKKSQALPSITKDARNTGIQTSVRNVAQVSTQTSSKRLLGNRAQSKPASTKTSSKRRPPDMGTKTSTTKRILPDVGVQTSCVAQPVSPEYSYTSDSDCGGSYKSSLSCCSSFSASQQSSSVSVNTVRKELENQYHNWMVTQERVSLEKLLEFHKKKLARSQSELKMYKVELVKKEMAEKKLKDEATRELANEWKRNVALKAMLESIEAAEHKQKFEEEKCKLKEAQMQKEKLMMLAALCDQADPQKPEKQTITQEPEKPTIIQKPEKKSSTSRLVLKEVIKVPSGDDVPAAEPSSASLISQSSSTAAAMENWEVLKEQFEGAMAYIEQLRASVVDMFMPKLAGKVDFGQGMASTRTSRPQVPSTPSRKSCVEKLPSVVKTMPVNLTAAPLMTEAEEQAAGKPLPTKKSSFSDSARNEVIKMWNNAMDEVEAKELAEQNSEVMAARKASLEEILREHLILSDKPAEETEATAEEPAEEVVPEPVRRLPTPPLYVTPRYSSAQSFSSQMSLRTITEGAPANFHSEFISPLATHSQHAVCSFNYARSGLHTKPQQEAETEKQETEGGEDRKTKEEGCEMEDQNGSGVAPQMSTTEAGADEPEEMMQEAEEGLAMVPYHSTKTRLHLSVKQEAVKTKSDETNALPEAPPTSPVAPYVEVAQSGPSNLAENLSSAYQLQQLFELSENNLAVHSKDNLPTVVSESVTCLVDEGDELERQKTSFASSLHDQEDYDDYYDDAPLMRSSAASMNEVGSPTPTVIENQEAVAKCGSSTSQKSKTGSSSSVVNDECSVDCLSERETKQLPETSAPKICPPCSLSEQLLIPCECGKVDSPAATVVETVEMVAKSASSTSRKSKKASSTSLKSKDSAQSLKQAGSSPAVAVAKSEGSTSQKSMVMDSPAATVVEKEEMVTKCGSSTSQKSKKGSSTSLKSKDSAKSLKQTGSSPAVAVAKSGSSTSQKSMVDSSSTTVVEEMVAKSGSSTSQKSKKGSSTSLKSKDSAQSLKQAGSSPAVAIANSGSSTSQKSMVDSPATTVVEEMVAKSGSSTSQKSKKGSSTSLKSKDSAQSLKQAGSSPAVAVAKSGSSTSQKSMVDSPSTTVVEEMVAKSGSSTSQKSNRKLSNSNMVDECSDDLTSEFETERIPGMSALSLQLRTSSTCSQESQMRIPCECGKTSAKSSVSVLDKEATIVNSGSSTSQKSKKGSLTSLKSKDSVRSLKQAEPPTTTVRVESVAKSESSTYRKSSSRSVKSKDSAYLVSSVQSLKQADSPTTTEVQNGETVVKSGSSTSQNSRKRSSTSLKSKDSAPLVSSAQSLKQMDSPVAAVVENEETVAKSGSSTSQKSRKSSSTSLKSKRSAQSLKQADSPTTTEVQNGETVVKSGSSTSQNSRKRSSTSLKSKESAPLVSSAQSLKQMDSPVAAVVENEETVAKSGSSTSQKSRKSSSTSLKSKRSAQSLKQADSPTTTEVQNGETVVKSGSSTSQNSSKRSSTSLKSKRSAQSLKQADSPTTTEVQNGETVVKSGSSSSQNSRKRSSTSLKSKESAPLASSAQSLKQMDSPVAAVVENEETVAKSGSSTSQKSRKSSSTSLKSKRSAQSLKQADSPTTTEVQNGETVVKSGSSTSQNSSKRSSTSLKSKESAPLVSSAQSLNQMDSPVAAVVENEETVAKSGSNASQKSRKRSSTSLKSKRSAQSLKQADSPTTTVLDNEEMVAKSGSSTSQNSRKRSSTSLKSKRSAQSLKQVELPTITVMEEIVVKSGSSTSQNSRKRSSTSLKSKDSASLVSSAHSLKQVNSPTAVINKIGSSSSQKSKKVSSTSLKSLAKHFSNILPSKSLEKSTASSHKGN